MNSCFQGIHLFFFSFLQSFVCWQATGRRGSERERVTRRTGRKRWEERPRDQHVVQQGVNRAFRLKQNWFTVDFNVFFTLRRTSFLSWIWMTTPTPWANWHKPSCCRQEKAKRGKQKRRQSLPCRNRKWPCAHRKWMRMKTTATLMTTAAMMRGETCIFLLILMLLYLILFAKKDFFRQRNCANETSLISRRREWSDGWWQLSSRSCWKNKSVENRI